MGGAHNVALEQLKDQSRYRVEQGESKNSYLKVLGDIYKAKRDHPITKAQLEQNTAKVIEFAAFIFCGGLCIAFFVSFKTYHASLQKLDKLTDLFNNPKARVANGDQGKRIMKKLQQSRAPKTQKKLQQKHDQNAQLNDTLKKVHDLLAAQKTAAPKKLQQAPTPKPTVLAYEPPKYFEAPTMHNVQSYQLQEPIIGTEPLLSAYPKLSQPSMQQPLFAAQPQNFLNGQLAGYPQLQMQRKSPIPMQHPAQFTQFPMMMPQQPKPQLPELSKADLTKILLAMLAKEDLEA